MPSLVQDANLTRTKGRKWTETYPL